MSYYSYYDCPVDTIPMTREYCTALLKNPYMNPKPGGRTIRPECGTFQKLFRECQENGWVPAQYVPNFMRGGYVSYPKSTSLLPIIERASQRRNVHPILQHYVEAVAPRQQQQTHFLKMSQKKQPTYTSTYNPTSYLDLLPQSRGGRLPPISQAAVVTTAATGYNPTSYLDLLPQSRGGRLPPI